MRGYKICIKADEGHLSCCTVSLPTRPPHCSPVSVQLGLRGVQRQACVRVWVCMCVCMCVCLCVCEHPSMRSSVMNLLYDITQEWEAGWDASIRCRVAALA